MTYSVRYTEAFHEAPDAPLDWFEEQGAPESRVSRWPTELLDLVDEERREVQLPGFRHGARKRPRAASIPSAFPRTH